MRQDDYNKAQLVTVGWRWGREYGGYLPALMIMGCVANRVRCGWGSWLQVIERIPHFTAEDFESKEFPSVWEPGFVRLLHEVDGVYDNSGVDLSKGALYWADLRRVTRTWFKENIIQRSDIHPRIVDCGSLVLFK